jgi:serine/threonine protein kinase
MITKEKHVKIIDFGMAKKVDLAYSRQEDFNSTVGTLPYMVHLNLFRLKFSKFFLIFIQTKIPSKKAPELVKFKEYDARVDVYSLGVVIYEMGSGLPFIINNQKPV